MDHTSISPSRYCDWPPRIIKTKELGYLEDTNGRYYPRDGGCSSAVNGLALYQFGDTFAHDGNGNFVAVSCSNASLVRDPAGKPQLSTYCGVLANGAVPVNPPLLQGEEADENYRTTTWCFGGIVFTNSGDSNIAEGYTFFQKSRINLHKWEEVFQHTGVAKVSLNISANQLSMSRRAEDDLLFKISEPKFGTFSAVFHNNYVYAYGHAATSKDIVLARVPFDDIRRRERYKFYDGTGFQSDMSRSAAVMTDMQHGTIYHSHLFQPNTGKDWVFVGCNSFADSTVYIGVAPNPQGPWQIKKLIPAPPRTPQPDSHFTYCMYAHPWAYDETRGELMVSWSEGGMRGRVVAVKVTLGTNLDAEEEPSFVDKVVGKLRRKYW